MENIIKTTFDIEEYSCTWSIENFTKCMKKNVTLNTSNFTSSKDTCNRTWRLKLYTKELKDDLPHVGLFLEPINTMAVPFFANIELSCVNLKLNEAFEQEYETLNDLTGRGYPEFFSHKQLLELDSFKSNDTLIVSCNIHVTNLIPKCAISHIAKIKNGHAQMDLGDDFCELLKQKLLSDVVLEVHFDDDKEEIKAHKAILAARSPVFAAMFQHELQENVENNVKIIDIRIPVFKDMLTYMYTGEAPNLKLFASDLLMVADKYDLKYLKKMCEQSLQEDLSAETCIETLRIAKKYNALELSEKTIQYMAIQKDEIIKSAGWKELIASKDMHLMSAVMDAISR